MAATIAGGKPTNPARDPIARQAILDQGLKIWRKPGAIQGGAACATCHSPDGIEIAVYNFDDANILRRANPHLGAHDANLLVDYFHAFRSKLNLTRLRDPIQDRPLQPGGSVLPGKSAEERDLAFGLELQQQIPLLFGDRIETIDQAKAAEQELLRIQPKNLRIGIPLSRLSEDIAHGDEHSSINQWLPEVPPAIPIASREAWYAAEDEYLKDPTPEKLHALISFHTKLLNTNLMLGLARLSATKFRALLVLQDRIRNGTESTQATVTPDVGKYGNFNQIWEVGEVARDMMNRNPTEFGMDSDTKAKKLAGPSFAAQMHQLRVGWFWAGWLSDQGLFNTSHDDKIRLGMWLSQSLSQDGPYPIHDVFANARRQAVVSNDPAAWAEPIIRKRRIWDFAGLRSFAYQTADLPKDPAYRKLTVKFTANCFRMSLLLLKEEIQTTHAVWIKESSRANAKEMLRFLSVEDPADSENTQLLAQDLTKLIDGARERNDFAP